MKTQPLSLAFAARPRAGGRSGILAAGLGAVVFLLATVHYLDARSQAREMEARIAELSPRQSTPAVHLDRDSLRALNERVRAVNLQIETLNTPWDEVFRAVRVPEGIDVVLVGLDSAKSGVLRLHGESGRFESMTDYVDVIAQRHAFSAVQLVKHEAAKDSPRAPYRFTVEAAWRR